MYKLQIPKRTRNNYKNGKQTNLQVPGTRKAVQKSQQRKYQNSQQTTKYVSYIRVK